METMYNPIAFSPVATLTASLSPSDTIISVSNIDAFPPAPSYATIGTDADAETIRYSAKTGNQLSGCVRGVEGTAKNWEAGENISRNFTAKDHQALILNIKEIDEKVNISLFNDLAQLGIETGNETIEGIVSAMPNNSVLIYSTGNNNAEIYPTVNWETGSVVVGRAYGICTVKRGESINRTEITFHESGGGWNSEHMFHGGYHSNSGFVGWYLIANGTEFLSLTGGTLSGRLFTGNGTYNGYGSVESNSNELHMVISDNANENVNPRLLKIKSHRGEPDISKSIFLGDFYTGVDFNLFGEHNKPSGTYVGNGSASVRNIVTGGVGKGLLIYSETCVAIASQYGVFGVNNTEATGSFFAFGWASYQYDSYGVINIQTNSSILNKNGTTYTYQVF